MTAYRAYIFKGVQAKHRDYATEAEAVAAVAAVRDTGEGWDGWTEPVPEPDRDEAMVAELIDQAARDVKSVPEACPDKGTCHHGCDGGPCFRVRYCGPLSGVFPGDRWPAELLEQMAGER